MREKDIKFLWGRSGNRCANCKIELTADGDRETVGEMAHIVAKSPDGPRGDDPLPLEERDRYNNLILLCPTDHTYIDKNVKDWPIEKLKTMKQAHEAWVAEQLDSGNITVTEINYTEFLQERIPAWYELSRGSIAIVVSLTPLTVADGRVEVLSQPVQDALETARLPGKNPVQTVRRSHTRPSEFGIVNERFLELPKQNGRSFHLFKSGHCEYIQELGAASNRITEVVKERGSNLKGADYAIHYIDIAEMIDAGLPWLQHIWHNILPYEYMNFQCTLLHCKNSNLYSYEDVWEGGVFGSPVKSEPLVYDSVISKSDDFSLLELNVLKWVANSYGLILDKKLADNNDYARPVHMR